MRKLLFNKKGDAGAMGIGAMILMIAMILVAGVAASVMISTTNMLQSQALSTGSRTTREVASGLRVFSITGLVNKTNNIYENITCLAITVEPQPGSDRVNLNNSYILISDGQRKVLLSYAGYNNADFWRSAENMPGDVFDRTHLNWSNLSGDQFGVGVLQDYDGSMTQSNPVLNRGDKAVIYIRTGVGAVFNKELGTRIDVFGQVVPEVGAPGVISFTSPKAYSSEIYILQ
jgi:archaeal flagellin FlaB